MREKKLKQTHFYVCIVSIPRYRCRVHCKTQPEATLALTTAIAQVHFVPVLFSFVPLHYTCAVLLMCVAAAEVLKVLFALHIFSRINCTSAFSYPTLLVDYYFYVLRAVLDNTIMLLLN